MKNPSSFVRYSFLISLGFLFVGILFTMTGWPAAELFSIIGGVASLVLYGLFSRVSTGRVRSVYPRHVAFGALVVAQILRSLHIAAGSYFLLVALAAFIIWLAWSVLEQLPPAEND